VSIPALATRGIDKRFGSLVVAKDIGLTLPQGERKRTSDQTGTENDCRTQGTRKILFVYGSLTSVPGGNPRTST